MKCQRCNERDANPESRFGLCGPCFAAGRAEAEGAKPVCRHCGRRKPMTGYRRGLCYLCFNDRSIRGQYPTGSGRTHHGEPTEAELDALIAEQMKCLPPWWHDSQRRFLEGDANE